MSGPVLVGLLDSGVGTDISSHVAAARSFALDDSSGQVVARSTFEDRLCHGSTLARIIVAGAPEARIVNAQVFLSSFAGAPAVVAAGLEWLTHQRVRVVNMSFGLRHDREVLRRACSEAEKAGIILLASAPARGPMVYPAGYDGVVRVSGDARCEVGETSTLGGKQADFGACPRPLEGPAGPNPVGGASFAVAHLCGILAAYLAAEPTADRKQALSHLESIARYHGPERRSAGAKASG